jgi:hypothetical protein
MRIINGHDYYDSGLAGGHDDAIRFERTPDRRMATSDLPESLRTLGEARRHLVVTPRGQPKRRMTLDIHPRQIGTLTLSLIWTKVVFCGKLYSGIALQQASGAVFYWDEASFVQALLDQNIVIADVMDAEFRRNRLAEYFNGVLPDSACRWLMESGITVMIYHPLVQPRDPLPWTIDSDGLKAVQFYKVLDAYTAFQEIAMWIGGILATQAGPVVDVTDDRVKAHKHGFDKHSFRKTKT